MARITTVASLAAQLGRQPEALLEQLQAAGLPHTGPADTVTEADKTSLLTYMKRSHGRSEDAVGSHIALEMQKKRAVIHRNSDDNPTRYMPLAQPLQTITLSIDEYRMMRRVAKRVFAGLASASSPGFYLDYVYALVTLGCDTDVIAERHRVKQLFRIFLRRLVARVRRCSHAIAAGLPQKSAQTCDVVSCLRAKREATIHPAFAPPRVVI
ncbi:hypothetical protein [Cupriavidus sp. AU9028]|uniref:hypothetical protein n=1 Tax=Cupriavidus sp. AU9028 TaxID=2871157 RepID=UPI001C93FD3F|nr:hypothetical protein [Cupriavidus sp. AU9028]MBY4899245.1 hypothetical protein [Cupriavidus sp. AU9028]